MILGILQKEWHQHRLLMFFSSLLLISGLVCFLGMNLLRDVGGSDFYILSWVLWLLLPLHSLLLANALIADEFRQKTQIFLEGLPLSRSALLSVKYSLGLTISLLVALALLGLTIFFSFRSEAIASRFAGLLILKTALWAWFSWSAMFALGFLGRYRLIVGLAVLAALMFMKDPLEIPVDRYGPFELIGQQFPYERVVVPVVSLKETVLLIAGLTITGFWFGLARDASLASMLAEKMSSREKLAITAIVFGGLAVMSGVLDRISKTEPLYLPGAVDTDYDYGMISAAAAVAQPTDAELNALAAHSQAASQTLGEVAEYLGIIRMPMLFIVHRRDFETGKIERGDLSSQQGVLVRINALENNPDDVEVQRYLIREVLSARQHRRLNSDTRGWVLHGFATWWPVRKDISSVRQLLDSLPASDEKESAAIEPAGLLVNADGFNRWLAWSEELGTRSSQLVAATAVTVLKQSGEDRQRDFLQLVLAYDAPYDFRATVHDFWYSLRSTLHQAVDIDLPELSERVHSELKKL
jgi:ABC-2 family transporter protein